MKIYLTPEHEKLVAQKVTSGLYVSASDVIREGLRLLAEQDLVRSVRIAALKKEIEAGFAQAEAGEFVDGEKTFARIRKRARKQRGRRRG